VAHIAFLIVYRRKNDQGKLMILTHEEANQTSRGDGHKLLVAEARV
jgi:hypothetical protein